MSAYDIKSLSQLVYVELSRMGFDPSRYHPVFLENAAGRMLLVLERGPLHAVVEFSHVNIMKADMSKPVFEAIKSIWSVISDMNFPRWNDARILEMKR